MLVACKIVTYDVIQNTFKVFSIVLANILKYGSDFASTLAHPGFRITKFTDVVQKPIRFPRIIYWLFLKPPESAKPRRRIFPAKTSNTKTIQNRQYTESAMFDLEKKYKNAVHFVLTYITEHFAICLHFLEPSVELINWLWSVVVWTSYGVDDGYLHSHYCP